MKDAIQNCLKHAQEVHYRDTKQIADLMHMSIWNLYKWIEEERIPLKEIRHFEQACGCDFITRRLAADAGLLVITPPTGHFAEAKTINELLVAVARAVSSIFDMETGGKTPGDVITGLNAAMESMAWQRHNISMMAGKEPE